MGRKVILGVDVGGTNMRFGFVTEEYELTHFEIVPTQQVLNCDKPLAIIEKLIKGVCSANLGDFELAAVSIGFPSTIDKARRQVRSSPNIKSLQNLAVADYLESVLDVPVYVNRDVNFLFEYDMFKNNINSDGIIVGFYIGTGYGNAISIGGKLLLGKNGVAAELGHIPTYNNSRICGCGNEGCAETIASGVHLEKLCREKFPDTPMGQVFTKHRNDPELIGFVNRISLPIATEINIFDPDYIIIGGGVTQMADFPMDTLIENVKHYARKPYPEQNLEILFSSPKQENGVIGAGIYGFKRLGREDYL